LSGSKRALVIGAGLAGCTTALALARRGWSCRIIAAPGHATASDIPVAVLAPPPLAGNDAVTTFRFRAARFAQGWHTGVTQSAPSRGCLGRGVLLVPKRERDHRRLARLPVEGHGPVRIPAATVSSLCGVALDVDCVFHPAGGWFDPSILRRQILELAGTPSPIEAVVCRLMRKHRDWVAFDVRGEAIASAPICIVAAGMGSAQLLPSLRNRLTPARGQATAVIERPLELALSGPGYAVPDANGRTWFGATIERGDAGTELRAADDTRNLRVHDRLWPDRPTPRLAARFAAVRATTRDRLPLAGELDDDLWVNAGHGTQGLLTSPLTASLLARAIATGRGHPLLAAMAPDRPTARHRDASATVLP